MTKAWMLAAAVLVLGGSWTPAEACSCLIGGPMPPGLTEAERRERTLENTRRQVRGLLDSAYAIFSGEAIAKNLNTVTFKLDKSWKGDLPAEFQVASGPFTHPDGSVSISSCDFAFTVGQKYLVFAKASTIAAVEGMPCTPTGELKYAADVVAMLNELAPKLLKPGSPAY